MRIHSLAVALYLTPSTTLGFTSSFLPNTPIATLPQSLPLTTSSSTTAPSSHQRPTNHILYVGGGLLEPKRNADDDDDDDDDYYDDESPLSSSTSSYATTSAASLAKRYANLKLDPYDPDPPIKPRPGRFGFRDALDAQPVVPDDQLVQTMTSDERKENLRIMRRIKKEDLPDLRMRKDHAGWIEANEDLKSRQASDPWFAINERAREAYQLGNMEELEKLRVLSQKIDGPPPGVTVDERRGYAVHTAIFDIPISRERAQSQMEQSILEERVKRGRAMMAERKKNQEREQKEWEETMRNPLSSADKEGQERRERTMRRLLSELDEDNKKMEERAREVLGELPDKPKDMMESLDKALELSREDVLRIRKMRREGKGLGRVSDAADLSRISSDNSRMDDDDDDDDDYSSSRPKSSAARAREAAEAEASGGRPRLPGDPDIKLGEIELDDGIPENEGALSSSTAESGPVTVQVTSSYNTDQSDPPMRKHCFQYTIRIVNNSPEDTIQLLSRRFEIQTVGSSMKDVVQGEGVTGRQPILKPGEVFEYTSTAPLSVRPIGTTIIAARMRGEYKYVTLQKGQDEATEEQAKSGGDASAELGMFHFVFPEEQRVKPIRTIDDDDDDEDDDDVPNYARSPKSTVVDTVATTDTSPSAPPSLSAPSPATTLPGDPDMTSGDIAVSPPNDSSDTATEPYIRVQVTSTYRPERSDPKMDKHCFAYSVRITNTSPVGASGTAPSIQLVSRRFEIQTIGSDTKDVVQGPGVTGRQPMLKPGESFEYTSTAPLSVRPMKEKTGVVARMQGEYSFVVLDGSEDDAPKKAKMGVFHFVLPEE